MHRTKLSLPILWCLLILFQSQLNCATPKPPMGHIRIWHFASALKVPVSVSMAGGASQSVILARALTLSDMINYREVPVGQYKLAVRAAAKDLGAAEGSPELISPVQISVTQDSFQTIILQDQGTTVRVLLANDTESITPRGGRRLRIFNFAVGRDASLKISPSNQIIAARIPPGMSEHIFQDNPGSVMLVMSNRLPNGHEAEQPVEANFRSVDSISAVVMLDRYSRLTFVVLEDGKIN